MDFLIVSYVFFAYQIKVPHIASNDKFMRLSVISKILRMSGMFFIKHSKPVDELFLAILSEYITRLLKDNQLVEFFIEGIRSRSGKILTPRYEMLSLCANAYFEEEIADISFVPITINYNRIIESETFPMELIGENPENQSILRLLKGLKVLNQNFGSIHLTIGEPLILSEFSKPYNKNKKEIITKLGYELIFRLQETSVIMPTSILAAVLLMNRRMVGEDELFTKFEWIRDEINNKGYKVSGVEVGSVQSAVKNSISLLGKLINHRKDLFDLRIASSTEYKHILMLAYYSNSLQHLFVVESIIACTMYSFGEALAWEEGIPLSRVTEEALFLASLLKYEFVCREDISDPNTINNMINLWKERKIIEEFGTKLKISKSSGMAIIFYCSLIWPMIDTYWSTLVFCSALHQKHEIQFEKLLQSLQWFVENMFEERSLSFYESCSHHNIKHALLSYEKMEILKVTDKKVKKVLLTEKYIENTLLEEILVHIAKFRKISLVQRTGVNHEIRRALIAEFPKI